MKPETLVSVALLALFKNLGESVGFRSDVVRVLLNLEQAGVSTEGLGLRWTPDGIESEEVARFVGRLTMGGFVVQESPIRLTPLGVQLLAEEVQEHADDAVIQKAVREAGLEVDEIAAFAAPSAVA